MNWIALDLIGSPTYHPILSRKLSWPEHISYTSLYLHSVQLIKYDSQLNFSFSIETHRPKNSNSKNFCCCCCSFVHRRHRQNINLNIIHKRRKKLIWKQEKWFCAVFSFYASVMMCSKDHHPLNPLELSNKFRFKKKSLINSVYTVNIHVWCKCQM